MTKFGVIIIFTLIVLLSFIPQGIGSFLGDQQPLLKRIITVDDEPGDADYTSIKEALNHSSPGDTIEVYSGTYYEHRINISKEQISLIGMPHELGNGSDTGKPFINGQGLDNVINVNAHNVTITGFHVENHGAGAYSIIRIEWGADGCVVSDNYLSDSVMGIVACASNFSLIVNNTIRYAGIRNGVTLGPYGYNTVSDNVIENCPTGICFWGGSYNTIRGNRISSCYDFGIDMAGATHNTFRYNTIENSTIGFHINGVGNRVEQNNFMNNTRQAGFDQGLGFTAGNRWMQNYWGGPRSLPYPIHGTVFVFIPWVQFDWRPALRPYTIL